MGKLSGEIIMCKGNYGYSLSLPLDNGEDIE